MAQQAIYFEILLLRSLSHFGWNPFPLHPLADAFHFVKEPGVSHLKGAGLEYTLCHYYQKKKRSRRR